MVQPRLLHTSLTERLPRIKLLHSGGNVPSRRRGGRLSVAREFRHPLTPAEAKIWDAVRNRQLGFKVRRQHAIGRFIVDFYCAEVRLAIEIDWDAHSAPDQAAYDAARTAWLEERGYKVIRFEAGEVGRNFASVLEAIRAACEARAGEHVAQD